MHVGVRGNKQLARLNQPSWTLIDGFAYVSVAWEILISQSIQKNATVV
jgi:hypothetical protein